MHDDPAYESEPRMAATSRRQMFGRLRRLVLKELREILRDRRTIITLVVMPLLIYPLLAVAFQRFLLTSISVEEDIEYVIGVDSQLAGEILDKQLRAGSAELEGRGEDEEGGQDSFPTGQLTRLSDLQGAKESRARRASPIWSLFVLPADKAEQNVASSAIHLAILHQREQDDDPIEEGLSTPMLWQLVYRAGSPSSEAALHFVESRLQAYNELALHEQLERLGVVAAMRAATERRPISYSGAPVFSLAALIPLILVLMTVTGAVYPAIDLTAGERERGTLETLIAAPVPRLGLLMAKYVAVLTVALLTALVNIAGMTITAHTSGLAASLFGGGMTLDVIVKVLLLLALFAAFFSAILLALTSCARSFKEAQAYIIPLMLLCLVPGVLCLMPGLEFTGWMAVTPLVNIVMLARDLLEGSVNTTLAVAAVCSTIFYIAAAIGLAARIFGTDAILYGSPATWSDLMRRPAEPQPAVSLPAALFGLALMFPAYFLLASGLGHSPELAIERQLVVIGLITAIVFGGIPLAITMFGRVRASSGLALRRPSLGAMIGAALLGLAVWPFAHEVYLLSKWLGLSVLGSRQLVAAEAMLEKLQTVPLWLILISMAAAPAVFEELCFRGFLFTSLRTKLAEDRTVIVSAILFGLFHEILFPGRFLASTFLGLVLGWVRLRTASVIPGMLLHFVHNSLLLSAGYYRKELIASGWGMEERTHLPAMWLAVAAIGVVLAVGILIATTRRPALVTVAVPGAQPRSGEIT